jgi:hypothetical protein
MVSVYLVVPNLNLRLNQYLESTLAKDFKASAVLVLSLVQASVLNQEFLNPLQILVEACSKQSLVPIVAAVCSAATLQKTLVLK